MAEVIRAMRSGGVAINGSLATSFGCPMEGPVPEAEVWRLAGALLEAMGYVTGVDLTRLLGCARSLPGIVGHEVPGQVAKAGRSADLHPAPEWLPEVRARAMGRAEGPRETS